MHAGIASRILLTPVLHLSALQCEQLRYVCAGLAAAVQLSFS